MQWYLTVCTFAICIVFSSSKTPDPKHEVRKFPNGFLFGAATAAYQTEGKTPNIWDTLSHQKPCKIKDCHTGDIAANSYHMIERDVEMLRELGLDYYRFSISWARILPNGFANEINEAGVKFYNNRINEMLKYNIEPMITLYHWDLPQKLQDLGGWTNPHIVDWYSDYVRICFELFGDRVKNWITINEPHEICYHGYSSGWLAPQFSYGGYADYMCAKHVLVAHAKAYHMYNTEFRSRQGGVVGISLSAQWYEPATDSEDDISAAEDAQEFEWGLYANPIFSEKGDYPEVMKQKVAAKSIEQGYPRTRLPELTPEEISFVHGSSDFMGINHYTTYLTYRNESVYGANQIPSMEDDMDILTYSPDEWEGSASDGFKIVPWGFYKLLASLRTKYNNPPIYITENGFSTSGGLEDDERIKYYVLYLDAMLDAIEEGSDVRAYTPWSLMDCLEWTNGYGEHFGLYEVDYESPARTRTPRKSAFVFKQIVRTRELDPHYEPPQDRVMIIDEGH
ncbi:glycosyl hydrolase family 1 domain-containing protein [Phthorimaea operculella]|nr:glycosyl hydrolase family 1 domain-containing protein [Phthorimaea operculella]